LQGTNSSANCENPDAGNNFSCGVTVSTGHLIIVFAGCLAAGNNCQYTSITDSQGNVYTKVIGYDSSCGIPPADCYEAAYTARASATGTDTLAFTANKTGYLGADVYAVSGYISPPIEIAVSGSMTNGAPSTSDLDYFDGSFVVAGVIANSAAQFMGGRIDQFDFFTMIPGQPCFSCGQVGGWQASEYNQGLTVVPRPSSITPLFRYPGGNSGWVMIALEFRLVTAAKVSLNCLPSPAFVGSQTNCSATVNSGGAGVTPTGNVTWSSSGHGTFSQSLCNLSSGTCSVSYTPRSVQSPVTITARYGGDSNNYQNSTSASLNVGKAASNTAVSCAPSPEAVGAQTTCSATVTGFMPSGTISWASSGVANFSPAGACTISAGSCAVNYTPSTSSSPVTITGSYSGDANNTASSGSFPLAVSQSQSTTSAPTSTTSSSTTTTKTTSSSSSQTNTVTSSSSSTLPTRTTSTATVTVTSSLGLSQQSNSTTIGTNPTSSGSNVDYVSTLAAILAVAVVLVAVGAYALIRVRGRSNHF